VRAAIRPKVQAIGKTVAKHLRKSEVNPDVYMRFLLEEPNPYMTGQMFQEKLATQLELNHNAFAYINRDENGYATELYPITCVAVQAVQNKVGEMFLKFTLRTGKTVTLRYTDIIHLRKDFNENDIFGESPAESLKPLMEVITTTDQGVVKAIRNSNVIRWLLKFQNTLRPEDLKKSTKEFVQNFLSNDSEAVGAEAADAKYDAVQVKPNDFVPNEKQTANVIQRIYSFFNTNEKIVQASYNEDEWISYYESSVEPIIIQMSGEFSRKLFSRRERGHGNKIIFESSNLSFASMATKLQLVQFVDRGIMTPNEVREVLSMAPIEGGDVAIRRLDTAPTDASIASTESERG
jgi:HK97 family phage portal protein